MACRGRRETLISSVVWKIVLILSLLPLIGAWLGRQWFWNRVRLEGMRHDCGTNVSELRERLGLPPGRRGQESHAAALGNALRECGLLLLERDGNPLAKARIKGAFLTRVLPALAGVVAVFGILAKRIPAGWAVAGVLAVMAFWTVLRLIGMAVEWRAVARAAEELRSNRALKRVDDEEAVIRCAKASAWSTVWPF